MLAAHSRDFFGSADEHHEDRAKTISPETKDERTAARALVARLGRLRWRSDSISPCLAGATRVAFLSDQLFDHGRLRSPIRGEFLKWRSHWMLARYFEERALSDCGTSLANAHDAFEPFRNEMDRFRVPRAEFEDQHGPLTDEALFGADGPIFDPPNKWVAGLIAAQRELTKAAQSFQRECLNDWRVVRILDRAEYATLVAPNERLDDRDSSEVKWIFSSDLPADLLCEIGMIGGDQDPAVMKDIGSPAPTAPSAASLRQRLQALERDMSDWFRDEVASGAPLRPKRKAERAIKAEARKRGYEIELPGRAIDRIWDEHALENWRKGGSPPLALC